MEEQERYEKILDEISQLLDSTELKKGGKIDAPLPKDIEKKVSILEKLVGDFKRTTEKAIVDSGWSMREIQERVQNPPDDLNAEEKNILSKAKNLRTIAEERVETFEKAKEIAEEAEGVNKGKPSKKALKRKSKFRGLGGKKGWKPI